MPHHHHRSENSTKNIKYAFFINLAFTIFELFGGLYLNSIAIISDAIHDLGDSLSLGTSWFLSKKSQQGANAKFSFGYRRFSLLGALINSAVLIAGSLYVIKEAIGRIIEPEHSNAQGMLIFAIIGVVINGYAALKVSRGKTLNERVISWHLIEDVLGWFAIVIVAIILQFQDIHYLDPALSLLITIYILWNAIKNLREVLFVFLQGKPHDISYDDIEKKILAIKNVVSIHHTHIWSLDGEKHVFTSHVKLDVVDTVEEILKVKNSIKETLDPYSFEHCTIETEVAKEVCKFQKDSFNTA